MNQKHKVLHTRVSEELYDKISHKARKHHVTISNFIRNLVEDYTEISGDIFDIVDEKIRAHLMDNSVIIGYQSIILSKDTNCDKCSKELKRGVSANMAFLENSRNLVLCDSCKEENEKTS